MYDELLGNIRQLLNYKGLMPVQVIMTYKKFLSEAADAIEELSKPKWIPVTERLPDSGVCVLVTDGLEVGEGWITEIINTKGHFSRWCCPTADIDVDWRPITHWMPLPEPPKEE